MDLDKTLEKVNKDREQTEAAWVFCLWKDPDLYGEYTNINEGKDKTLKSQDAIWYFQLGKAMWMRNYKSFDNITIHTFLEDKPAVKKQYEAYGGWNTIDELRKLVDPRNVEAYFDKIVSMNMMSSLAKTFDDMFNHVERFNNASSDDIYKAVDLAVNSITQTAAHNEDIENLVIDKQFLDDLAEGKNVGFNYSKFAPLLNYITLGAAPGSLYMVAGHSGTGKSSFVFGNMLMGLHYSGVKTAIISNEMQSDTYKILLLEHVLTQDLNYWGLTRKQLKLGKFTPEQQEKIQQATQIIAEQYSDILFVKMFDNEISKIMKFLKRLSAKGVSVILYDTFKSDDQADSTQLWQSLMLDARRLFQCASKLGMCCITTYQLALHTTNQRYLDATCLSQSKQIKEVYETMVYFRPIWDDEFAGQKYDIKPYRINGKVREEITLDKDKKYLLLFIDKTRADEDKQVLIYQWNARFNTWKEVGFARVINDHRALG